MGTPKLQREETMTIEENGCRIEIRRQVFIKPPVEFKAPAMDPDHPAAPLVDTQVALMKMGMGAGYPEPQGEVTDSFELTVKELQNDLTQTMVLTGEQVTALVGAITVIRERAMRGAPPPVMYAPYR